MKSEVRIKTQSYMYIIYFYDTFKTFLNVKTSQEVFSKSVWPCKGQ